MVVKGHGFRLPAHWALLALLLVPVPFVRLGTCEARSLIDRSAAIAAAYLEAQRLGYDPADLQTQTVKGPMTYPAFAAGQLPERVEEIPGLEASLRKKTFWYVSLSRSSDKVVFGGSLEAFIDASNAGVLKTLRGK